MRPSPWLILVFVASVAGVIFASFSTYDFVQHLDRQVHGIHCSFLPGIEGTDASGATGCHVTLMSPYSSVMRTSIWGGIPISLPAMAVFSFLAFAAVFLILTRRNADKKSGWFLVAATSVPLITSIAMGYVSLVTLDAACKMCIGIYASSGVAFLDALLFAIMAGRRDEDEEAPAPPSMVALGIAFLIGVVFVTVPVVTYASTAPDFERYIGACGELSKMEIADDILVPMGPQSGGVEMLEVLDPLCPACRGFERRFEAAEFSPQVSRRALLFPLDTECNWMISSAIHPGACAVSEAILCADDRAGEVLAWAFEEQDAIRTAAEDDPEAPARMVSQQFPFVAECIGTPTVRARLNLALRFAVDNQMPIITPQVYIGGTRLCDEDTDLGMDFALSKLLERTGSGAPRITTVEESEVLLAREVERDEAPRQVIQRAPPEEEVQESADAGVAGADAGADAGETPEPLEGSSGAEDVAEAAEALGEATSEAMEAAGEAVAGEGGASAMGQGMGPTMQPPGMMTGGSDDEPLLEEADP
jgi:uncharacterized membrane protein